MSRRSALDHMQQLVAQNELPYLQSNVIRKFQQRSEIPAEYSMSSEHTIYTQATSNL